MITLLSLAVLGLTGCGGDPTTSYCEAACDLAVTCNGAERTVDEEALLADCLAATRGVEGSCAKAEEGTIDPASRKLLDTCVTAVIAMQDAGECDPFTGSIDEIKTGTPPTECATVSGGVKVWETARDSARETGDQLCQRFTDTYCSRASECILGDFGGDIPQSVTDAMGGTPYDLCVDKLDFQTTSCQDNALYQEEESLSDVNGARQSARECLTDFTTVTCDDLFAGDLNEFCAGAFDDPQDLVAMAQAMYELSEEFQAAAGQ